MKKQNAPVPARKKEAVEALKKTLESYQDVVFFDYRGFSTQELTQLRFALAEKGALVKVVKNNILARAINNSELEEVFKNPTAAIFCQAETASQVTKSLLAFFKENKKQLLPKGALADQVVWQASQMEAFSKLPSRLELIATLIATAQAPVRQFVQLSNDVTARFVRALKAVEEKKIN